MFKDAYIEVLDSDIQWEYHNNIFKKLTKKDINYIKKSHDLGTIEFIYITIWFRVIIKIGEEFKYFEGDSDDDYLEISKIDCLYENYKFETLKHIENDKVHGFVEVCDDYITLLLDDGERAITISKNNSYFQQLLTEYNLKSINYEP